MLAFVWHREPRNVISTSYDCICLFHSFLVIFSGTSSLFFLLLPPLCSPLPARQGWSCLPPSFSLRAQCKAMGAGLFGFWTPLWCSPPPRCSLNGSRIQPWSQREHEWEERKITETPLVSEKFPGMCPWKPHGSRGRRPKEILSFCSLVAADALPDGGSLLFHACNFASEKTKFTKTFHHAPHRHVTAACVKPSSPDTVTPVPSSPGFVRKTGTVPVIC